MNLQEVEEAQVQLLTEWFDTHPQPSDEWRNAGRAQDLIRAYNEKYATESWEVLAVEEEFEVEVGEVVNPLINTRAAAAGWVDATIPCYLAGRKDLVVAWHGGLWVVDHKTASDWGSGDSNSHLDEGRRSFQFRGYAWAEREKQQSRIAELNSHRAHYAPNRIEAGEPFNNPRYNLPLLGTVGNYLISRKPYAKPPANGRPALPRNQFHRECYAFEPSVLDEWRSQFLETARDVLAMWQRGVWPHYDTGCGHWGRCEFFDYCEEAPERREAMLSSSMFQQKEFEREL